VDDGRQDRRFGRLLRRCRIGAGLTQEELAQQAGLSVRAISDMERGMTRRPFLRSVRQLADALRLSAPERALLIAAAEPEAGLAAPAGVDRADGHVFVLPVPRQLPSGVARFTGRTAERDALAELVGPAAREAGTAVVISGTAGVGKTTLAVHFAHEVEADFPDGQLYVNLRGALGGRTMAGMMKSFDSERAVASLSSTMNRSPSGIPARGCWSHGNRRC
jgi:transcriptional regulator with XRE-family HTH domain